MTAKQVYEQFTVDCGKGSGTVFLDWEDLPLYVQQAWQNVFVTVAKYAIDLTVIQLEKINEKNYSN